MRTWRNWQTRKIQVLMVERLCRFKSCCPHHRRKTRLFGEKYEAVSRPHIFSLFRLASSPPADNRIVRNCDANVPRYIHISAFPNGVRYSVLASLVLTSPVKSDILILVCTTTASSYAVHAHAPRHFRASPFPAGVRCKASPVVRTRPE